MKEDVKNKQEEKRLQKEAEKKRKEEKLTVIEKIIKTLQPNNP